MHSENKILMLLHKKIAQVFFYLIFQHKRVTGSLIGGMRETQEMMDFCGEHGILCDVEVIKADYIGAAYGRMLSSDVKYRFVIDCSSI